MILFNYFKNILCILVCFLTLQSYLSQIHTVIGLLDGLFWLFIVHLRLSSWHCVPSSLLLSHLSIHLSKDYLQLLVIMNERLYNLLSKPGSCWEHRETWRIRWDKRCSLGLREVTGVFSFCILRDVKRRITCITVYSVFTNGSVALKSEMTGLFK